MSRIVAVGLLVGTLLAGAAPARASLSTNTFGASGTLTADGRMAVVSVLIGCTAPGSVHVTVTVTQGSTSGVGHGGGRCTGESETYTVRVPAGQEAAFAPGAAAACGHAVNQEPGGVRDVRDWCREGGVQLRS